jgi:hypothetical protein
VRWCGDRINRHRITRVDQGAIVENKRLSEALEMCRAMQAELPPKLRSRKAPARTSQEGHILAWLTLE